MKVSELIEALQKRLEQHGDTDIEVTWEGTLRAIDNSSIYLDKKGSLLIDADDNFYKRSFAMDPNEGEEAPDGAADGSIYPLR